MKKKHKHNYQVAKVIDAADGTYEVDGVYAIIVCVECGAVKSYLLYISYVKVFIIFENILKKL